MKAREGLHGVVFPCSPVSRVEWRVTTMTPAGERAAWRAELAATSAGADRPRHTLPAPPCLSCTWAWSPSLRCRSSTTATRTVSGTPTPCKSLITSVIPGRKLADIFTTLFWRWWCDWSDSDRSLYTLTPRHESPIINTPADVYGIERVNICV